MTREAYRHAERIRLESRDSIKLGPLSLRINEPRALPEGVRVPPPHWSTSPIVRWLLLAVAYTAVSLAWHAFKRHAGM